MQGRASGLPPRLRHPLIDTFGNSPIHKQAKIFCAAHTVLAHRDVSRAVVPPLGLLHRRELRDHDSFDRSFTLKEVEWSVRGVELDVEPHESPRHIFPICLQFLPIAHTLANIDEIGRHRLLLRFGTVEPFPGRAHRSGHDATKVRSETRYPKLIRMQSPARACPRIRPQMWGTSRA